MSDQRRPLGGGDKMNSEGYRMIPSETIATASGDRMGKNGKGALGTWQIADPLFQEEVCGRTL